MERFVFVAAIFIAVLFGLGAVFGSNFHFEIDGERRGGTAPLVEVAPGRFEAQAFSGDELEIRYAAAIVTITPEDRTDYLIEIDNSAGRTPLPEVSVDGGDVVIDGRLRGRISRCTDAGGADLRGYGDMSAADLPRINIRAPRDLRLERGGAGATDIGALQSLDLDLSGCSAVTAGDVADRVTLDVAGSGSVRTGSARTLSADVAGAADVNVGAVAEGADVDIAGSGSVTIASLNGDLSADGAGSGNVRVLGGSIAHASVDLAGSGDVDIAAPVQRLNVSIVGSGNVDVQAPVGDIEAEIAGSGNVRAASVTGAIRREVWGSGEVRVGSREASAPPAAPSGEGAAGSGTNP
jgi:hypothetical protein